MKKQEYSFWKRMGLYSIGLLLVAAAFGISTIVIMDAMLSIFIIMIREVE